MSSLPSARANGGSIAIAGGGPAGLALAIRAARAGFETRLFERASGIPDKACGEGLMPKGLHALEALCPLESISPELRQPFAGIRYALEDGRRVDARFRHGSGMGIRRVALSQALREAALAAGASIERASVRGFRSSDQGVSIDTDAGEVSAQLLVGADGLQSPLRRAAGLDGSAEPREQRRYGLRRHFACAPWSDLVEVHWIDGGECYVTPIGPKLVNIAFLWEPRAASFDASGAESSRFDDLLARFPAVKERLGSASTESESRGAGPLLRPSTGRAGARLALVGDAAGYVDAITGQGLSLAFAGAEALVGSLPHDLGDAHALADGLARYDRSLRSAWRRYALPARALLALARRPSLRRSALTAAVRFPKLFSQLVESISAA